MLKPKITLKPITRIVNVAKKAIVINYVDVGLQKEVSQKIVKQKIFDNFIALVLIFWAFRDKNILTEKVECWSLKINDVDQLQPVYKLIGELFLIGVKKINENKDYFEEQDNFVKLAEEYAEKIMVEIAKNSSKSKEDNDALESVLEVLLNFNFIDLYTFKIEVATNQKELEIYKKLVKLIEVQMSYLDNSYEMFRCVNSVNFNTFFKIIVSLRKSLI
ncbi:hypothetical protein [[Mycoplasma] testudinis]|uniref:hypothetical protein n=1 Tax=[Mycoplasma] testudinis TaxID=33924 RepID=UPI00048567A2|nr:hypothetical protein [[Mycoplasma] testudinis]